MAATPPPLPKREQGMNAITIFAVAVGGALIALVMFFYAQYELHVPETYAQPGDEVSDSLKQVMRRQGLLQSNEVVLYFYSEGIWSVVEDGNMITDKRVVSWTNEDHDLEIDSQPIPKYKRSHLSDPSPSLTTRSSESTPRISHSISGSQKCAGATTISINSSWTLGKPTGQSRAQIKHGN